jgi:hypothetical protein
MHGEGCRRREASNAVKARWAGIGNHARPGVSENAGRKMAGPRGRGRSDPRPARAGQIRSAARAGRAQRMRTAGSRRITASTSVRIEGSSAYRWSPGHSVAPAAGLALCQSWCPAIVERVALAPDTGFT